MSTEADNKLNGSPEPFRRPVNWGRAPGAVFRAGPLPRGERLPPLPEPPRPAARGILNGSLIPGPAPVPAPTEKQCPECLLNIPIRAKRCGHCAQTQPA